MSFGLSSLCGTEAFCFELLNISNLWHVDARGIATSPTLLVFCTFYLRTFKSMEGTKYFERSST